MKNTLFVIALGLLTATATYAQTENPNKSAQNQEAQGRVSPEERATRQTKMLAKSLELSADQESKVQALNLKRLTEISSLREKQAANRDKVGKEAKTIRSNWETELKKILTPEQYAKYEAQKGEAHAKRSKRGGANRRMQPAG